MSVLIFDTETTDRDPGREIIEAAWLRLRMVTDLLGDSDGIPEVLTFDQAYCQRFRPVTKPLSFGAMAVHHILPQELAYLIGHSIDFDWEAAGSPPDVKRIDTCAMAKWTWPDADSYSQSALLYMLLGAKPLTRKLLKDAHSAAADAANNLTLLNHILAAKPEIRTWSALWEYSERCRIPRTCPMRKYEGVLLADLDRSFIFWCLRQDFIDPYYRRGLEQVLENDRKPATTSGEDDDFPL